MQTKNYPKMPKLEKKGFSEKPCFKLKFCLRRVVDWV